MARATDTRVVGIIEADRPNHASVSTEAPTQIAADPGTFPAPALVDDDFGLEERPWYKRLDWPNAVWIGLLHVGALAAFHPYFFSWKALALVVSFGWFVGCIGICMGFHRCLTHGSFSTWRPLRWLLALIGGLAGEGSALTWVAVHRKHHVFSDQEGDPHSPRDGAWWSHMLWLAPNMGSEYYQRLYRRYAPDLFKDRVIVMLHKTFLLWHWLFGVGVFGLGYWLWDVQTAWSFVVWGVFVRMVYVLHVTWFVNSATHMWGYKNYDIGDDSTNLWWVGLLAYGEGWHNNHHAFQRMARHGHRWWEIDVTYWVILALEKLGIVWNVVHDVPQRKQFTDAPVGDGA